MTYRVIHRPHQACEVEPGRIVICPAPLSTWYGAFTLHTRSAKHSTRSATIRIRGTGADAIIDGQELGTWNQHLSLWDVYALCHEFGHAIGLEHYGVDRNSCLGAPLGLGEPITEIELQPSSYDRQSLTMLYQRVRPAWP